MTTTQITAARRHGVNSISQLAVLGYLLQHGRTRTGILAIHINASTANITGILDCLYSRGLILRHRETADRRVIEIDLTIRGADLATQLTAPPRSVGVSPNLHPQPQNTP